MSKSIEKNVGIISEGRTDFTLLNEIVCMILNKKSDCIPLQPTRTSIKGWGGVWDFCTNQIAPIGLEAYCSKIAPHLDILVVSIDGDVTRNGDVYCSLYDYHNNGKCQLVSDPFQCYSQRNKLPQYQHCAYPQSNKLPNLPISDRKELLESVIAKWLKIQVPSEHLIITIPFDMIETWIICAMDGPTINGVGAEEYIDPYKGYLLKKLNYHGWIPQNNIQNDKPDLFSNFAGSVISQWSKVVSGCDSARIFNDALIQKI